MNQRIKTDAELTDEQKHVLRDKGTEAPFSGEYWDNHESGMYRCAGCGHELFDTDTQFVSKASGLAGWPSFADAKEGAVVYEHDDSHGMNRTEVVCAHCGGHLGHLFEELHDGTNATSKSGKHFCINSCALDFESK